MNFYFTILVDSIIEDMVHEDHANKEGIDHESPVDSRVLENHPDQHIED